MIFTLCFFVYFQNLPFLQIKYYFFLIFTIIIKLFFWLFLAKVCFLVLFFYNYSRVKRQVQRRVKSASVSEPTSRVRCNVCCAPRLKHKYATQTKKADLQTTSAEQDKTNKLKQHSVKQ